MTIAADEGALADPGPAVGRLYLEGHRRIVELLEAAPECWDHPAAACPGWSLRDVLAHLTGVCDDVLAGRLDGVATDDWTLAQVQRRRDATLPALLAEWEQLVSPFADLIEQLPGWFRVQPVVDLVVHEHDLRGALGAPPTGEEPLWLCLDFLIGALLDPTACTLPIGRLRITDGARAWEVGAEALSTAELESLIGTAFLTGRRARSTPHVAAAASLQAPPLELFRALTGRRSEQQIRAMTWSTEPTPYLPLFACGPFQTRSSPLVE